MPIDRRADPQGSLFYLVDWLPPDFGAVGQYALIAARQIAAEGRAVHLIGLTTAKASEGTTRVDGGGTLSVRKLAAKPYEKTRFFRRLLWTVSTNTRLMVAVLRHPNARGADVQFTGSPPFMLYFAIALKYLRSARLVYRITDFYPEALIAHIGRRGALLALAERITWSLRRKVDMFEVCAEDQRTLLLGGGIAAERIRVKRDTAPVTIAASAPPAPRPPPLADKRVLLYSGNYGVAHEVDTVAGGLVRHHRSGSGRFGLWLNATGQNADVLQRQLAENRIPVARSTPVSLNEFPALLAAADVHLIALRPAFSGIVFPSKVYACILSGRPIIFVGPKSSDVHLLCSRARQRYIQVTPGDADAFAQALDEMAHG
jgi:hypothetical protein